MDAQTIATYDAAAARIAAFHRTLLPTRTQELVAEFFHPAGPTADIGCGSGRDTAWLAAAGYPVVGYDASEGMLAEARAAYPGLSLARAALPELAEVPAAAYANLLCNAVLMHLPAEELPAAVRGLARALAPGGRLLLVYRPSTAPGDREADGRLFTTIAPDELARLAAAAGLSVLHREARADAGRPHVIWHTLVAERCAERAETMQRSAES